MGTPDRFAVAWSRRAALAGFWMLLAIAASAADTAPPATRPVATVRRDGDKLAIDVRLTVAVPPAVAWEVLTDFDHMASFIPSLSASAAIREAPNLLRVRQQGTARWGPLSFDFESDRRIALTPNSRIESTTLSGKIKKMHSLCELVGADDGTRIHYHADAEIDFWLPPLLGTSAMRMETEEQFTAMAAEMLRRHGDRPAVPP